MVKAEGVVTNANVICKLYKLKMCMKNVLSCWWKQAKALGRLLIVSYKVQQGAYATYQII